MSCVTGTYARGHISQPHRQHNPLMSGDGLPRLYLLWLSDRWENIEHQSSCMSRKWTQCCGADVHSCGIRLILPRYVRGISVHTQEEVEWGGGTQAAFTTNTKAARLQQAHHAKGTWRHLHFPSPAACFLYLLGGERLRPVVQDEPVFVEGFGLRRRFLALLAVCDLAVLVHRWDGPPATVGGGNMVGRRHDRAFCVRV